MAYAANLGQKSQKSPPVGEVGLAAQRSHIGFDPGLVDEDELPGRQSLPHLITSASSRQRMTQI